MTRRRIHGPASAIPALAASIALLACGSGSDTGEGSSTTGGSGAASSSSSGSSSSSASSSSSSASGAPDFSPEPFEGIDLSSVPAGKAPVGCAGGYDPLAGKLTVTLDGSTSTAFIGVVGGVVQINGVPCSAADSTPAAVAKMKALVVQGSGADEIVILDLATGSFAPMLQAGGGAVTVDLGGGDDAFWLRGTMGNDQIRAGGEGSKAIFDLDGDGEADVRVAGTPELRVSLGPGDDSFRADGALGAPLPLNVFVWGGPGDDQIRGGDGDDRLHGGDGDDTFVAAAKPDGADIFDGGPGYDTVDYSARQAGLSLSIDGKPNDGETGEGDAVGFTIETVIGGDGDDTMTAGPTDVTLRGGPGNDVIKGGPGNDSLYGDEGDDVLLGGGGDDTLDGGEGHDTFDAGDSDGDFCIIELGEIPMNCELY